MNPKMYAGSSGVNGNEENLHLIKFLCFEFNHIFLKKKEREEKTKRKVLLLSA